MAKKPKNILTPTSPELSEDERAAAAEAMQGGHGAEFMVPVPTHIDPKTKQWVLKPMRARLTEVNEHSASFIMLEGAREGGGIGIGRTTYGEAFGKKAHHLKVNKPMPIEEDPKFQAVK